MCEFCEKFLEDDVVLAEENIPIGILGEIDLSLEMLDFDGKHYLSATAFFSNEDVYRQAYASMNYCPKCGRNLINENSCA